MASGSRARSAARRQQKGKSSLSRFATYAIIGVAFVAFAGILVVLSRGSTAEGPNAARSTVTFDSFTNCTTF